METTALETIEENLGYHFGDPSLLARALTRKEFADREWQQGRHLQNQEVLTTLGDSVLTTVFIELLIQARYPTRMALMAERENLGHQEAVVEVAGRIGIAPFISTGIEGDELKKHWPEILADTMRAIIGALYLDGGFEPARTAIVGWYGSMVRPHLVE
jgi:ribonuclease-3